LKNSDTIDTAFKLQHVASFIKFIQSVRNVYSDTHIHKTGIYETHF